jgi:acetolactate synthase I/II/III large subunit
MKIRVADYITHKLYEAGGQHVFLITGGMIMYLTDALLQHGQQKYICCHHEQAAVMAADAYGRLTGRLGVAYVTAGPGALNTLTGVVGAYVDSAPCIIVAGQSKVSQAKVTGQRQFALQGFNTLPIFKQVTKYAVMLEDVSKVKHEIEKSIYLAKSGRVGPVWIECPIDIQGTIFDPDEYEGFHPPQENQKERHKTIKDQIGSVVRLLLESKRPCILAGAGVRLADAIPELHKLINITEIPTLTSRLGLDLMGYDHPLFIGHPGTYGDRPANFAIQNSDLILVIGCRLSIGLVSYDFQNFASHAKKIIVDIDEAEFKKPSVKPDISVLANAKDFLTLLNQSLENHISNYAMWIKQVQDWKKKYPVDLPEYKKEKDGINSYHFTRVLSEKTKNDDVFVLDTGSCFHVFAQAFKVKYGQRHIITGGLSTMGYMPASIGAAVANSGKDVYCITGDGSIQMNLQELQTIIFNKLPIKIICFNNNGYLLIRHTQNNFMEGRLIGESPSSGVGFPDLQKIAKSYNIPFIRMKSDRDLRGKLDTFLNCHGPIICEVMTPTSQLLIPRVSSKFQEDGTIVSMPYDDMYPFLSREEYLSNCVHKINPRYEIM